MRFSALLLLAALAGAQEAPNLAVETPPSAKVSVDTAVRTAVAWLVKNQNKDGSWGKMTSGRTWEVSAHVPGGIFAFRAATTAICWLGLNDVAHQPPESRAAQKKALAWLVKKVRVKRAHPGELYNTWSFGFGLHAVAQALRKKAPGATEDELRAACKELVKVMATYQTPEGGWGYYDFRYQANQPTSSSISFVNGTVLVAFAEAKAIGVEPPDRVVKRAIAAINRQRKRDFSYLYGEYLQYKQMRGINRPGGSLGRSQCCNCALRMWGDKTITDNVIKNWLFRLYVRNGWLDIGRKRPIPHESWMQVAGYFYYYGHYYAALCLEQLPESQRGPYQPLLAKLMLDRQEKDGSWWDYPLYDYHQPYGTAFALMTLDRCQRQ